MKSLFLLAIASMSILLSYGQDDKAKRPSPPATVKETLASGAEITINYSQPSVKGRTIGKDLEPMDGQVWRAGANEATTVEFSKDVTIEGKKLPAGKYSFFTLSNGDKWTLIFNKTLGQWGAYKYNQNDDVLRVDVKSKKAAKFAEKLTYTVSKDGLVTLNWGDIETSFKVK